MSFHDTLLLPRELVEMTPGKAKKHNKLSSPRSPRTLVLKDETDEVPTDEKPSDENLSEQKIPKSSSKKKRMVADNFEDLVERNGGGKWQDALDTINKGGQLLFNSTICSLIKNGKIIFKNEISKGKYGTTILSKVRGLKKNEEYVVKIPHTKKLPSCITKSVTYIRNDGLGETLFPTGSYSCDAEFSEFIISLFVADLVRKKQSVNFLDTFYFARCFDDSSFTHFMFMEKADTTLKREISYLSIEEINSLYIQLLHSLAIIQNKYSIVHGDLHLANILLKMTKPVCRTYTFDGETIYAPSCKYIVFPADWGMAVKYSEPAVGNVNVLKSAYGDSTPNFFSPAYDIVYLTKAFLMGMHATNMKSDFIRKINDWILFKTVDAIDPEMIYYFKKGENTYRPKSEALTTYFSHVSPLNILKNADLMGVYMKKPKGTCEFGGKF